MKQYESPQETKSNHTTAKLGGSAPSKEDIVKSANARSMKRHDTSGDQFADVNVRVALGSHLLAVIRHAPFVAP